MNEAMIIGMFGEDENEDVEVYDCGTLEEMQLEFTKLVNEGTNEYTSFALVKVVSYAQTTLEVTELE